MEFLQLMENWNGFAVLKEQRRFSEAAVAQTLDLLLNTDRLRTHRHEYLLREAIQTADFPALFGFVIDRQMLAKYSAWIPNWRAYCATGTLPNFNVAQYHKVYGNDEYLPRVPERAPYPETVQGTGFYPRQVFKHGRAFGISWEAQINDILRAFQDIPERFATAAARTVARDVTSIFSSPAGPNPALFGAPIVDVDGQNVVNQGNLALDITNLQTTLDLMSRQTDPNGEPILVRGVHLVVPPPLEFTARSILNSAYVQNVDLAGAANAVPTAYVPLPVANVVAQYGLQLHVDPYLMVVDRTPTNDSTWYVFADPAQGKAMQMDFLAGHESPEVCMKMSNKIATAGGMVSPFDGDFETDNTEYRVRIVHGGAALDPRFAYAQVGP